MVIFHSYVSLPEGINNGTVMNYDCHHGRRVVYDGILLGY